MLHRGEISDVARADALNRKTVKGSAKHGVYMNTRCTYLAQEEHGATPAGVQNRNPDSSEDDEEAPDA